MTLAPESYQEYLTELGQKLNALERLTDKATGIDDRLDVLVRLGIEQLRLAKSSVMAQPLLGAGLPAYNIRKFELDTAATTEVQVPGNTVIAYSDGTLEGCYIRLEDATSERIPLNEFNASYYSLGFSKFWVETDSQPSKYLRLLILRGLPGSVITEMAVNIAAQTLENLDVDIVAQSVENLTIDIAAQTVGDITISIDAATIMAPVDIQGAYIMMPVDIQAQYVNLEVDIVAQTIGNIAIDLAAQSVGNLAIDINAQTVGNLTIDIETQSVGIYLKPEWAAKESEDKTFSNSERLANYGADMELEYTVPEGETLYITDISIGLYCNDEYEAETFRHFDFWLYDWGIADYLEMVSGEGGGHYNYPIPLVIGSEVKFTAYLTNRSRSDSTGGIYIRGYEI